MVLHGTLRSFFHPRIMIVVCMSQHTMTGILGLPNTILVCTEDAAWAFMQGCHGHSISMWTQQNSIQSGVLPSEYDAWAACSKIGGCLLNSLWFPVVGESLISGVTGEEFSADIYIGPVYYQRLRHMVSDKFQVCIPPFKANNARKGSQTGHCGHRSFRISWLAWLNANAMPYRCARLDR